VNDYLKICIHERNGEIEDEQIH